MTKRGGSDGFRDALGGGFGFCAADFDFDDALGAFAIGNDLESERAADVFERGREGAMRGAFGANRWSTGSAVGEDQQGVVRRRVAINADGIEGTRRNVAQSFLEKSGRDGGVGDDESESGREVGVNHACAFGAAHEMNSFTGHFERSAGGFWASVGGADGER